MFKLKKMKKIIIFFISIIFFCTSCEKTGYSHFVRIYNDSSYTIKVMYKTIEEKDEFIIPNKEESILLHLPTIYWEPIEGYAPYYTKEEFESRILNVEISVVLENGDTTLIPKEFEKWSYYHQGENIDDNQMAYHYDLFFTDDMIE